MSEVKKRKLFSPKVGDTVMSKSCQVFGEPVTELTDDGFICDPSGLWEGTMDDWEIMRVGD
jgi:hypothetical protein